MSKRHDREQAEWLGFRDALEYGVRNPMRMPDHEHVAYEQGFHRGERAVERIIATCTESESIR
jgi:hypothetical protein